MKVSVRNVFIIVGTLFCIGIVIVYLANNSGGRNVQRFFNNTSQSSKDSVLAYWTQDTSGGWKAVGSPPPCSEPLELAPITDLSKATSVLYPGQMRSVGYENTAGFRFDGAPNDKITVTAPMDGEIIQAARFLVNGEVQYVFDILSLCGIMNRFDHLLVLSPKLQDVAYLLPEPKVNDSRSTLVSPPVKISKGEILATGVGLGKSNNTFISWTVFDLRKKNKASQNTSWAKSHPLMDHYVVCPFLYMSLSDQKIINSLPPADSMSGSKSDFCN